MFRNSEKKTNRANEHGFTLVEIMVVISIILILLSMAMPIYSRSLKRAREDALRRNLESLNESIDQYTLDKQKAPQSLDDLVQAGYLKEIPVDPITGQRDWEPVQCEEDTITSPDQQDQGGICDVNAPTKPGSDTDTAQQQ